jgi:SAM-dependent methyltransferase
MEVGCGAGRTGQLLRERGATTLIGVEINPLAASWAGQYYSELIIGDVEGLDLSHIPEGSLDCILYPDVLEHLRDPWAVLQSHIRLLRPSGFVVASIPNVRYYKAVRDLVFRGAWDYQDAGILDLGHLRFFTRKSIEELFRRTGLKILRMEANVRGSPLLRILNRLVLNRLHPFLVKQYLVLACKIQAVREDNRELRTGLFDPCGCNPLDTEAAPTGLQRHS